MPEYKKARTTTATTMIHVVHGVASAGVVLGHGLGRDRGELPV